MISELDCCCLYCGYRFSNNYCLLPYCYKTDYTGRWWWIDRFSYWYSLRCKQELYRFPTCINNELTRSSGGVSHYLKFSNFSMLEFHGEECQWSMILFWRFRQVYRYSPIRLNYIDSVHWNPLQLTNSSSLSTKSTGK